jgi:alpha-beta hydrolase superfamily lysophospholipase
LEIARFSDARRRIANQEPRTETTMNLKSVFVVPMLLFAVPAATGVWSQARAADGRESATLTTGDGAKLSARYFPSDKGAKAPVVIVLDDLGDEARPTMCDDVATQLSKDGCAVLCFEFRGCGHSRDVEPEFWDNANNKQMVKGYKEGELPETIRFTDFKPGYLPTLVNDVAAARAYLERRNDTRECNTGQIFLIGFGRGAAIGQLWLASEWSRYRVTGVQNRIATKPEGRDVAGYVWINPALSLGQQPVPMLDLMKRTAAKRSTLAGLILADGDSAKERFAKQCQEVLNVRGKSPLVATYTVRGDSSSRGEVAGQIGKFIAGMRKLQELPLWTNRNFGDRRYAWAFPGAAPVQAKDEGEDNFQPVPVDQLLGKR